MRQEVLLELSEGELPGVGTGLDDFPDRVVSRGSGGLGLELLDVVTDFDPGLLDVGSGPLDGDRQVAQRLRDLVGLRPAAVGQAAVQMGDALVPFEHGDVDGVHEPSPALGALTGDQHVTAPAVHHELRKVIGLRDVVQDEQPPAVRITVVERLVHRLGRVRWIRPLRQTQ